MSTDDDAQFTRVVGKFVIAGNEIEASGADDVSHHFFLEQRLRERLDGEPALLRYGNVFQRGNEVEIQLHPEAELDAATLKLIRAAFPDLPELKSQPVWRFP